MVGTIEEAREKGEELKSQGKTTTEVKEDVEESEEKEEKNNESENKESKK